MTASQSASAASSAPPGSVESTPSVAPTAPQQRPSLHEGIRVSETAVEFARKRLAKRGTPDAAIRLGVRGGGCSGFSYVIEFADDPPRSRDTVYEYDDVRFYVDKKSLLYLSGSVLDYEHTLMFQGFKFKNPHEASSCGCGHSFTVK